MVRMKVPAPGSDKMRVFRHEGSRVDRLIEPHATQHHYREVAIGLMFSAETPNRANAFRLF